MIDEDAPIMAHDLPKNAFPVEVEFFTKDGTVVKKERITGSGVFSVEPLAIQIGEPVGVRMKFANEDDWTEETPWN